MGIGLKARNAAVFIFLICVGFLRAQVTSSSISGHVYDPAGRVLRQARVTLEDEQHSFARTSMTGEAGVYSFIGLAPAVYSIEVDATGFDELKRLGVALEVDSSLSLDFHLKVGGPKTQIEVRVPVNALQTDTAIRISFKSFR